MEHYGLQYVRQVKTRHHFLIFSFLTLVGLLFLEIAQEIDVYSSWVDQAEEANAGGGDESD